MGPKGCFTVRRVPIFYQAKTYEGKNERKLMFLITQEIN